MKKIFCLFLLLIMFFCSGYRKPYKYTIAAEKDAYFHNNVGLNYLRDRIYYAAIQEFKIAIQLSPNTQSTAIFKNNLGETYLYIGYPDMARVCFEDAIKAYGLNLQYYINLADCYEKLNISRLKIQEYTLSDNIYDKIILGILYTRSDEKRKGITILDDVCVSEPDLLITPAIKNYIAKIAAEI